MNTSFTVVILYVGKHSVHTISAKPALPENTPIEVSRVMLPDDTNPLGNVHGGTILKLIEQAGGIVSGRHCNRASRSGSDQLITALARVEHMDFYQPMYVGEVAQLHAAVTYTSPHSCEVKVDVWAENILTGDRRHTNTAILWYVAFPISGKRMMTEVAPVPQLEGLTEKESSEGLKRYRAQKSSRASVSKSNSRQGVTHSITYQPTADIPKHTVLESQTTLASLILPSDCANGTHLMGGALMKMMDNAAGICAARHCRSRVVTACIDAIDFHSPVFNGEVIFCTARLVFCSSKSMEIEVITEAEGLTPGSRRVANTAYFTFVSLGPDRRAQKVPPLVLCTAEEEQRFAEGKARYEERKRERLAKDKT